MACRVRHERCASVGLDAEHMGFEGVWVDELEEGRGECVMWQTRECPGEFMRMCICVCSGSASCCVK